MIYLTGDTHGHIDLEKIFLFTEKLIAEDRKITKNDYLIILGDFGLIWSDPERAPRDYAYSEYLIDELDSLPFTVLFVEGNHENFSMLNAYPVKPWNGGKVSFIRDNVIHLKRGQVFNFAGKSFFTMGGATSIDKAMRTEGISWWKEENISSQDLDEAYKNLAKVSNTVDYVLTHAAPEAFARELIEKQYYRYNADMNEMHLRDLSQIIKFKNWYCGHYHINHSNGKYICLYNRIVSLEDNEEYTFEANVF